jgi:hypothetical protein
MQPHAVLKDMPFSLEAKLSGGHCSGGALLFLKNLHLAGRHHAFFCYNSWIYCTYSTVYDTQSTTTNGLFFSNDYQI